MPFEVDSKVGPFVVDVDSKVGALEVDDGDSKVGSFEVVDSNLAVASLAADHKLPVVVHSKAALVEDSR